jgi:hypothetical protein
VKPAGLAPDPTPRCELCRFFLLNKAAPAAKGICRRFPPTPVAVAYAQNEGDDEPADWRPHVESDDWCGEFRPAPCGAVQAVFGRVCVLGVAHVDGLGKATAHRDSGGHRWFS